VKSDEQGLAQPVQDFARHMEALGDVLMRELARRYDVSEEQLRKAIERRGVETPE